jgi:hypothetical protein
MEVIKIDNKSYQVDTKRKLVIRMGAPNEVITFAELFRMYDQDKVQMRKEDIDRLFLAYYNQ